MLKITAIVSLMLVGSTLWAASLSCDSCGSECASACGTRHFRSCCFNYLRKKRGPEVKFSQNHDFKIGNIQPKLPFYLLDDAPEALNVMPSDFKLYPYDDTMENRIQLLYDL